MGCAPPRQANNRRRSRRLQIDFTSPFAVVHLNPQLNQKELLCAQVCNKHTRSEKLAAENAVLKAGSGLTCRRRESPLHYASVSRCYWCTRDEAARRGDCGCGRAVCAQLRRSGGGGSTPCAAGAVDSLARANVVVALSYLSAAADKCFVA